jgi:hypothetical protein
MHDDPLEQERLRQWVLEALEHFNCPVAPQEELRPFLEGVLRVPIPTTELELLIEAEQQSYEAGRQRPVWLCLGIRPDLTGDPGYWTRSDWPLWWRIVHPEGEQVRRYWLLRQLFRSPVQRTNPRRPFPEPLERLYLQLAEQLPDDEVEELRRDLQHDPEYDADWEQDRWEVWCAIAERLFDDLADEDRQRREQIAATLGQSDTSTQLWGRKPLAFGEHGDLTAGEETH